MSKNFRPNVCGKYALQGSSRALYTPPWPNPQTMHLTCTIPGDWLRCADLKLSSQGWWSVGMIWSGGLVRWWRSDLMAWIGCRVWGWAGVVLGYGGLIWGGSGWLLWSFGLVWCRRKMVWSEYWKLERWEAELIVVNGSIKEKKGFMHKKSRRKIVHKEA